MSATAQRLQKRAERIGRRLGDNEAATLAQNVDLAVLTRPEDIDTALIALSTPVAKADGDDVTIDLPARPPEPATPAERRADAVDRLEKATAALRDREAVRAARAAAETLAREAPDMTPEEVLRKACEAVLGTSGAGTVEGLTKRLQAQGLPPSEARRQAADAVLAEKRAALARRGVGRPAPTEGVVEAAALLKAARIAKGLTQAEVADEAGVSTRAVQTWEAADACPNGLTVWKLADVLGLTIDQVRAVASARAHA